MSLPTRPPAESCADILRSFQSAEDAFNLVRGIVILKGTLGEDLVSQFVDSVLYIGSSQSQHLLKDPDLEGTYRRVFALSQSSSPQPPAMIENIDDSLPDTGPSVSRARTVGAAADLCDCPPRKEPYKTVRGLREHLMIKHGLSQAEAEAKAQGVFARLQAGNRYRARHESQSFSPAREYNIEDWNYQYGESTIDGVVADHVALPNWDRRA